MFKQALVILLGLLVAFAIGNQVAFAETETMSATSFQEVGVISKKGGELKIVDSTLYVLTNDSLEIYDISSTPSAPTLLGTISLPSSAPAYSLATRRSIAVVNGYAYVNLIEAGFQIIDVQNPREPRKIFEDSSGTFIGQSTVINNLLYVGYKRILPQTCMTNVEEYGMRIYDVTNPSTPQFLGEKAAPKNFYEPALCEVYAKPFQILVQGNVAYVLLTNAGSGRYWSEQGLWVLDISDAQNPSEVRYLPQKQPHSAVIVNNTLVMATYSIIDTFWSPPFLISYDISDPDPAKIRQTKTLYGCLPNYDFFSCRPFDFIGFGRFVVQGELLFTADLDVFSLQPLANLSRFEIREANNNSIAISGNHIFLSKGESVHIYQIPTIIVQKIPSRATLPPSGGAVAFSVSVRNISPADQWANPIQFNSYTDSVFGAIAPNPRSWEGDCYWWLPKLWPSQNWTCHFNEFVKSSPVGTKHQNSVTVNATSELGTALTASGSAEILYKEGPGVWSPSSWNAYLGITKSLFRPIDSDNDGSYDMTGVLIGDLNLNGKCDLYELWWARQCIPLKSADAETLITTVSTNYYYMLGRELLTTWLNIVSGNDYACVNISIPVNLSNLWLWQRSPQGNPLNGSNPVSQNEWNQISWAYEWLKWYNSTGGQNCAIDRDTGMRSGLGRSADDEPFVPLEEMRFAIQLTDHALNEYDRVLRENETLRTEIHALYLEVLMVVMSDGVVSADLVNRLEATFNQVVALVDQPSADEFTELWEQLDLASHVESSGRATWRELNKVVPTAVELNFTKSVFDWSGLIFIAMGILLAGLTLRFHRH